MSTFDDLSHAIIRWVKSKLWSVCTQTTGETLSAKGQSTVPRDGSLSLQRWGRIRWHLDVSATVSGGSTGTGGSMEGPDRDMTSHPNNKSAEMSSAIDLSVLCRNVALMATP